MKLIRPAVLGLTVAAAVLAPTAAQAKTYRHVDATGDVFTAPYKTNAFTPAPDRVNGDIVASTIKHKRRTVVVQLQYRDLVADNEFNGHFFVFRTSKMRRDVALVATGGLPNGQAQMTKPNGKKVTCHIGHRIDYNLNTATVMVPRRCLGNPRWVKVGMASIDLTGLGSSDTEYVDDALSTGTTGIYSPKIRR